MHDSLAILTCGSIGVTRRCLSRMASSTRFQRQAEFVVVDNGSTDGTREWLDGDFRHTCEERGLGLTLIFNDRNMGCSTARNQAVEAAKGDALFFLDNDVEPATPDWLEALRARLDSDQGIGIVGGLLLYPPRDGGNASVPIVQCASVGVSRSGRIRFIGRGEPLADAHLVSHEAQCLISACMAMRRDQCISIGGFDEAFNPVQFEDFDLCYRCRDAGWKAFYEPKAMMFHHESTTTAASPKNAAIVVRHGLEFKRRWRHMFSAEDGPDESECRWIANPNAALP